MRGRVTSRIFRAFQKPQPLRRSVSTRNPEQSGAEAKRRSQIDRLIGRLPSRLSTYITPLRTAPISHITAFLILHEITAVVPLVGLAAGFHYANWLPSGWGEGKWVREGVERFGRYFRRKGWVADEDLVQVEAAREEGGTETEAKPGGEGVRIIIEAATAYAITKALLPLRLVLSAWATPWFARVAVLPLSRAFSKATRRFRK